MNKLETIARALVGHAFDKQGNDPEHREAVVDRCWQFYAVEASSVLAALPPTSLVAIVSSFADRIDNGRTSETILKSIRDETDELDEEITLSKDGQPSGPDGIFGECVDILASTLDLIREVRKDVPIDILEREVADYLVKKCQKWERKYGQKP